MIKLLKRCIIYSCWLYAPGRKGLLYAIFKAIEGKLAAGMLVYLINNQINLLAGLGKLPGEGEVKLRLYMIIIHYIENHISHMKCILSGQPMGIICRINTWCIHYHHLLRKVNSFVAEFYNGNLISILAEASDHIIIIWSKITSWLFMTEEYSGILFARVYPYQISACRNRTGWQQISTA